ncbi:MAG: S41 family peptidase [Verrucomicrobiota bacterium]
MICSAGLMTMILGGAVTYFLLYHTPYLDRIKPEVISPVADKDPSDVTELPAIPPRLVTSPPPRLQQHLKPQENEVEEIIDLLRTGYLEPSTILVEKLNQDSLEQIFSASDHYVRLSMDAVLSPFRGSRNVVETLLYDIAYWRPNRLGTGANRALIRQWPVWRSAPSPGLIIDLRFFRDGNNFEGAAMAAGLFTNPGTPLFSIQDLARPQRIFRSEQQPLGIERQFPIIVLTNNYTRGAGEALAYLLKEQCNALIIGQPTAAEGGLYTETKLSSGRYLRLASTRVTLADGTDMIGRKLHPDIKIPVSPQQEVEVFLEGFRKSPKTQIQEPFIIKSRQQQKDATITRNQDIMLILQQTDITLQAAVDMIQAISNQRRDVPTLIEFDLMRQEAAADSAVKE